MIRGSTDGLQSDSQECEINIFIDIHFEHAVDTVGSNEFDAQAVTRS
jgi:hypothetical protein